MGEVVAFLAAVPAFIQLTKYSTIFAAELYRYAEDRKGARLEIETYANEASCASHSIRSCHGALRQHHQIHPHSIVLQELGSGGTLASALIKSKGISSRLKSVIRSLSDQNNTSFGAFKHMKWRKRKKAVLEILLQLKAVQGNMDCIVSMVTWEALSTDKDRWMTLANGRRTNTELSIKIKELDKEIREKKQIIKDQIGVVSRMEQQLRRHNIERGGLSAGQKALHVIGDLIMKGHTASVHFDQETVSRPSSAGSYSHPPNFSYPVNTRYSSYGGHKRASSSVTPSVATAWDDPPPPDQQSHRAAPSVNDPSKSFKNRKQRIYPQDDYEPTMDPGDGSSMPIPEPPAYRPSGSQTSSNRARRHSRNLDQHRLSQVSGESQTSQKKRSDKRASNGRPQESRRSKRYST